VKHPRLVEANQNKKRDEWMSALDKMESSKPRIVVAGHKNMKNDDDGPRVIGFVPHRDEQRSAPPAPAMDMNFLSRVLLIAVHDCVSQSFAER
jgi:hypothetical protein